ncbi:MAG: hypothetical protein FJY07_01275 [Bacteroidetes bacterium]|nr:hypothetical protein [Bacteroidota bacterium]
MKEVKLLEELIKKLDAPDFNLKAWKQYSIAILERVFGEGNQKIKQIEKIEVDYSSWSLRDTSGKSTNLETCKRLGKEILLAAIDELTILGIPEPKQGSTDVGLLSAIRKALENELKVAELKEINTLLKNNSNLKIKRDALIVKLKSLGESRLANILTDILADENFKVKF